jgi:ABC-type transport system substrate-binding protein
VTRMLGMLAAMLMASGSVAAQSSDVTIVLQAEPDQLDPCQATKSHVGRVIKQNVVETLTEIDPSDGTVGPRLATAWRQIDDSTWRFKLREGVTFHDPQATIDDPRIDGLIERAGRAAGAEREQLYQEMFRLVHDEIVADIRFC